MKKKKIYLIIISVILVNILATPTLANYNYNIALQKGSEIFKVKKYNRDAWLTTVSNFSTPNKWFEGEANNTGAKSKYVIKGWRGITWQTYDVFTSIFLPSIFNPQVLIPLLAIMNNSGYNETAINNNFTNNYKFWVGLRARWNFTINEFDEKPIESNDFFLIFKDPADYNKALNDYNNIAEKLNNEISIKMSGYSFPYLNGDQLLWYLIQSEFAIAKPFNKYLSIMVEELGCNNATVNENLLVFTRSGKTNYTVEILFGSGGTMASFIVKDIRDEIIYQIIRIHSEWIFNLIIIILSIFLAALSVFLILRRRKIIRMRRK